VLLQTPFPIAGFQPYGMAGAGVYRETLDAHRETAWAFHSGVGVKRRIFGPLMVRLDYRGCSGCTREFTSRSRPRRRAERTRVGLLRRLYGFHVGRRRWCNGPWRGCRRTLARGNRRLLDRNKVHEPRTAPH
jgi:hypothetical protein